MFKCYIKRLFLWLEKDFAHTKRVKISQTPVCLHSRPTGHLFRVLHVKIHKKQNFLRYTFFWKCILPKIFTVKESGKRKLCRTKVVHYTSFTVISIDSSIIVKDFSSLLPYHAQLQQKAPQTGVFVLNITQKQIKKKIVVEKIQYKVQNWYSRFIPHDDAIWNFLWKSDK